MLHVVRLFLFLTLLLPVINEAAERPVADRYQEPSAALLQQQQELMQNGMKGADAFYQDKTFLDSLATERQRAQAVPNNFKPGRLDMPENVRNQTWADRFNEMEAKANEAVKEGAIGSQAILIFVSFSLPEATIKSLAAEAKRAGGVLVFRGLKGDDLIQMRKALTGMGEGFAIDPTLYRRFSIEKVPTFVLPVDPIIPCNSEGCEPGRHVSVAGNVTLEAALEFMSTNAKTDGSVAITNEALMRLRK